MTRSSHSRLDDPLYILAFADIPCIVYRWPIDHPPGQQKLLNVEILSDSHITCSAIIETPQVRICATITRVRVGEAEVECPFIRLTNEGAARQYLCVPEGQLLVTGFVRECRAVEA